MYELALSVRTTHNLGLGGVEWLDGFGDDVVAFRNGAVTVIANTGSAPVRLPAGEVVLASTELVDGALGSDATVWLV